MNRRLSVLVSSWAVALAVGACGSAPTVASPSAPPAPAAITSAPATSQPATDAPSAAPSPSAAVSASPSPSPSPTPVPLAIAAIAKQVTKASAKSTSAKSVTAAINAAAQADPNLDVGRFWKACQGQYGNQVFGPETEAVVSGCATAAIRIYLAYQRSGSQADLDALRTLLNYVWTRPEFNGSHQANKEIAGLIRNCQRFDGDTYQPCG